MAELRGPDFEHVRHRYEGEPDDDLIAALEPDQLVEAMEAPLPPRRLSPTTRVLLWGMRIFVLVMAILVTFVFVVGLFHAK